MCAYRYKPADVRAMKSRSIHQRSSKVQVQDFAKVYEKGRGLPGLVDSFPQILAGREFRKLVSALGTARARNRGIVWGVGGHVIKCGLGPLLVDLMERGFVTAFAFNGAATIHDFEIALAGSTSEEVEKELPEGDFGMVQETGEWMNEAFDRGVRTGLGMGESLGAFMTERLDRFPYSRLSILCRAYSGNIPVTVHVAIGTDVIHNHPLADGNALGQSSLQDFRLLTSIVRDLHDGGVYLNCGSAVILPEVFLKVVSMVRNLGYPLQAFTTANLDFIQHYRPTQNVLKRPVLKSGQGISITGHHELMIPLLAAALIEEY
jgi:hypothetical protein